MQDLESFLWPPSFLYGEKVGPSTKRQESAFQHLDKALRCFPVGSSLLALEPGLRSEAPMGSVHPKQTRDLVHKEVRGHWVGLECLRVPHSLFPDLVWAPSPHKPFSSLHISEGMSR